MIMGSDSYARPNNTTAYSDGDALSDSTSAPTVLNFANVVREAGGFGRVHSTKVVVDNAATGPTTGYTLLLFHTAPTAVNDNAAMDISPANMLNCVGTYTLTTAESVSATSSKIYHNNNVDHDVFFQAAAADKDLYGLLMVDGTYTPVAESVFTVEIAVLMY
jgi:hypothetical protein